MERRDQVLAVFLDALGIGSDDLATFDGRKRLQKAIYLVEQAPFNRDFGFRYNLYIRGPYCSELADAGYRLLADQKGWVEARAQLRLSEDCAADLASIRSAFGEKQGGRLDHELLELAATAHFLFHHTFGYIENTTDRRTAVAAWVNENKPGLKGILEEAVGKLVALAMIA